MPVRKEIQISLKGNGVYFFIPGVAISFLLGWAVTVTAGLMSYPIGKYVDVK